MRTLYADTSAVAGAYLGDEPGHGEMRARLFGGGGVVLTSRITSLELASAIYGAHRARRVMRPESLLAHFDAACGSEGPVALIDFGSSQVLPLARSLIAEHVLHALDAIHIATALLEGRDDLVFVTLDEAQARAAVAAGLNVA